MTLTPTTTHKSTLPDATAAWEELAARVDAALAAWESGEPPNLAEFLPPEAGTLRRLVLVELIKVDLEQRWLHHNNPKTLEEYLQEFPDLPADGLVPSDLIHEEFHIRKQAGDPQTPQDVCNRFPRQAEMLKRLLDMQSADVTTTLVKSERGQDIDIGQQIDDFDLLTRLGKGAFASVFLARQRSMQRLVALKVSRDRGNEPQTLAQLDHPHIVRVYDQRQLPDRHLRLLYMQHIPGGTLLPVVDLVRGTIPSDRSGKLLLQMIDQSLLRSGDSPPTDSNIRKRLAASSWPQAVCWLGARLASALDYAHQRGVLHRDVKPANVLLAADAAPKLADFNVSFSSKLEGISAADFFGGSLAYMSPEQLEACDPDSAREAADLDGRSDVYSLAVMLWELLTGHRPFPEQVFDGDMLKTRRQMHEQRMAGVTEEMLAKLPSDICPGMEQVLTACLAPNPDDRPQTAGRMALQLELCLKGGVQRLLRPKKGSLSQWIRRKPIPAVCMSALMPNTIASIFNIAYNLNGILDKLKAEEKSFFVKVQLLTVNTVVYSIGISIGLYLAWPVIQAVLKRNAGRALEPEQLPFLRRRALKLGDYISWTCMGLWCVSGFVFTGWLQVSTSGDAFHAEHFWHFLASQLIFGLIASTQTFFYSTLVVVRGMCPLLVQPEAPEPGDVGPLIRLGRRVWRYMFLAVITVPIAIMALALVDTKLKPALVIACVLGSIGVYLAFRAMRAIETDLGALMIALDPAHESDTTTVDTVESFWTSTR